MPVLSLRQAGQRAFHGIVQARGLGFDAVLKSAVHRGQSMM